MSTIVQNDQPNTSVQNIKSVITGDKTAVQTTEFNVLFENALGDTMEESTLLEDVNKAAMFDDTIEQTFDDYMAINLLVTNLDTSRAARPSMLEFMDATGANSQDASELLYGVIGSNGDYRDWGVIMTSGNPIDAARAATSQLYNSRLTYEMAQEESYGTPEFADELAAKSLNEEATLGKQGNFALHVVEDVQYLTGVSSSGLKLRDAGSTQEQIERTAWLFGFSTAGLGSLAARAESAELKAALELFV